MKKSTRIAAVISGVAVFAVLAVFSAVKLFAAPEENIVLKPLVYLEEVSNKSDNKAAKMESFPAAVMHRLINTRKFDICRSLDDLKKLQKERTGKKNKGAYLIRMTVIQYSIAERKTTRRNRTDLLSGEMVLEYEAKIVAQIEYADAMTGKVLESKRAQAGKKRDLHSAGDTVKVTHSFRQQVMEEAVQSISDQCVNGFMEMLNPVKILRASGKSIYINAGQDRVVPNELFNVYKLGEAFTDPDTGESLGADEEYVAQVKVVQAKQKYSIAEVVDGTITGKLSDYILRKCSTEQIAAPESESSQNSNAADNDPHGANPF
ncbi:MAG: hypothetical protein IJC27_02475 [Lentisphaeria bacterium]|nr:hypothetical protein [Lentisphaeria bacterium]